LILLVLTSSQAHALRCGNELIAEGDIQEKLLKYCGEPSQKTKEKALIYEDTINHGRVKKLKKREKWFYNFGAAELYYIVTLEKGRVTVIETEGYGFN